MYDTCNVIGCSNGNSCSNQKVQSHFQVHEKIKSLVPTVVQVHNYLCVQVKRKGNSLCKVQLTIVCCNKIITHNFPGERGGGSLTYKQCIQGSLFLRLLTYLQAQVRTNQKGSLRRYSRESMNYPAQRLCEAIVMSFITKGE